MQFRHCLFFFFQAEDGIRDIGVTGVQTCALPIFATRRSDGRIVLRETAQTLPEDKEALADLTRHRFASTNNLWFDLEATRDELDRRNGVLGLSLIKNVKTVDPADPSSPEVVQIESAMGAAIEVFDGARTIEVGRDRFVPVKTTNDLAVLRSDCYRLDEDAGLHQVSDRLPFVRSKSTRLHSS